MCALVARTENFHMQNFPIFVHSASLMDTTHMLSLHLIRTFLSASQVIFQQPNTNNKQNNILEPPYIVKTTYSEDRKLSIGRAYEI